MHRSTREQIEQEIKAIKFRMVLANYLLYKIEVLDELHVERSKRIRCNPARFGNGTARRISLFVKKCIDIFNESHPKEEPWTYSEMMFILRNAWFGQTKMYLDLKMI
jgi:hypothetical protein